MSQPRPSKHSVPLSPYHNQAPNLKCPRPQKRLNLWPCLSGAEDAYTHTQAVCHTSAPLDLALPSSRKVLAQGKGKIYTYSEQSPLAWTSGLLIQKFLIRPHPWQGIDGHWSERNSLPHTSGSSNPSIFILIPYQGENCQHTWGRMWLLSTSKPAIPPKALVTHTVSIGILPYKSTSSRLQWVMFYINLQSKRKLN